MGVLLDDVDDGFGWGHWGLDLGVQRRETPCGGCRGLMRVRNGKRAAKRVENDMVKRWHLHEMEWSELTVTVVSCDFFWIMSSRHEDGVYDLYLESK